jgi:ribosomal protein L7Ae-like RNA K-turn-binding protein
LQERLPGRGAYTCRKISCLRSAAAKKQFARAFKGEVVGADADFLVTEVAVKLTERIASFLSLANKAGKVISGTDQVMAALKNQPPGILFIASDISCESGQKVKSLASHAGVDHVQLFSKERLGALIGKDFRGVVAVIQSGFVVPLKQEIDKYRNFFEEGRE